MKGALLRLPARQTGPFIYVDCGARDELTNSLVDLFPQGRYIGFEPDAAEYNRLCQRAKNGYSYFPVAVGKSSEMRMLSLTRNPECSSLLLPDHAFWAKFVDCASQVEIRETRQVQTVALDSYLPTVGINHIDFLKLDTQGTELEILRGAEQLLSRGVLGVKVEVEFSPMYLGQPLFSDVDTYLRRFNFMLFDILRHHYRRQNYPRDLDTRGQLVYGDALYLKDYQCLAGESKKQDAIRLAVIASFYDFHDYALEIIDFLLKEGAGPLNSEETRALASARLEYISSLARRPWWVKLMILLAHSPLTFLLRAMGYLSKRFADDYKSVTAKRNFNWSD